LQAGVSGRRRQATGLKTHRQLNSKEQLGINPTSRAKVPKPWATCKRIRRVFSKFPKISTYRRPTLT